MPPPEHFSHLRKHHQIAHKHQHEPYAPPIVRIHLGTLLSQKQKITPHKIRPICYMLQVELVLKNLA